MTRHGAWTTTSVERRLVCLQLIMIPAALAILHLISFAQVYLQFVLCFLLMLLAVPDAMYLRVLYTIQYPWKQLSWCWGASWNFHSVSSAQIKLIIFFCFLGWKGTNYQRKWGKPFFSGRCSQDLSSRARAGNVSRLLLYVTFIQLDYRPFFCVTASRNILCSNTKECNDLLLKMRGNLFLIIVISSVREVFFIVCTTKQNSKHNKITHIQNKKERAFKFDLFTIYRTSSLTLYCKILFTFSLCLQLDSIVIAGHHDMECKKQSVSLASWTLSGLINMSCLV